MPKFSHKGLGVSLHIRDDLLQKDVSAFSNALRKLEVSQDNVVDSREAVLKAADAAGWFLNDLEKPPAELPANVVRWMCERVTAHFVELTTIPPE